MIKLKLIVLEYVWPVIWLVVAMLIFVMALIMSSVPAHANPGQCSYGNGGFGGGGFCDSQPRTDGTFYHCETVYVLGFGGTNCFWVRPVSIDVDPRGWVPA